MNFEPDLVLQILCLEEVDVDADEAFVEDHQESKKFRCHHWR